MKTQTYLLASVMLLLSLSSVLALGVTSPYWDERPLILAPGESKDIQFELQNMLGDSDATMRAALIKGQEVASLTDKDLDYKVPYGSQDVVVNMRVSVPSSAQIGSKYSVGVSFTTITASESGQFQLGSAFEKYFDVVVQEPTPESSTAAASSGMMLYIIAAIVVLAIIIFAVRRSKNN